MDGTEFFKRNVLKWVRMFKEGRTETSEGRGGAHIVHSAHEERVAEIKRRVAERRDCTIAELARETGIPAITVSRVVSKELKMVKKMCVRVPHLLTEAQVQSRIDPCRNNLLRRRRHPRLLKRMLVIDEKWPCDFNWFRQVNIRRSGKRFDNWAIAKMDINSILSALVEGKKLLGVQMLPGRWERVINNDGAYPTEH
nr:unnamed protein product [Haemonchus contortus]